MYPCMKLNCDLHSRLGMEFCAKRTELYKQKRRAWAFFPTSYVKHQLARERLHVVTGNRSPT